ncbi:hypothetical protein [Sphingomonas bacterium]|uniref:hypothetical protein n=1 Tax=Sphingomonas bacterium TaxID=1895847 RepID=UPI00157613ED|nr:hypothetical protein [Sphingomonas bacterium]
MIDPYSTLTVAAASLAGLAMVTSAGLAGWRGWLQLKRSELDQARPGAAVPGAGQRIELADLRERIRKLEAIAAGVEL